MVLAKKKKLKQSYADYLKWPDEVRCELIDGIVYDMTPAPSRKHQDISGGLFGQFWAGLKNSKCQVYHAPFDVRLPDKNINDREIHTVVQPDISLICNPKKLDDRGCVGVPDLIVEITSPATASKDMKEKFNLYEKHGVREYWIVHPDEKTVMIFKLGKNGEYSKPKIYSHDDKINVGVVRNLAIDLGDIFN
jgi:Uma2 family endonuclease